MEQKTISKGDRLGALLDDAKHIHTQMRQLFIDNGINKLDLTKLRKKNPDAHARWVELYERSNELADEISQTING